MKKKKKWIEDLTNESRRFGWSWRRMKRHQGKMRTELYHIPNLATSWKVSKMSTPSNKECAVECWGLVTINIRVLTLPFYYSSMSLGAQHVQHFLPRSNWSTQPYRCPIKQTSHEMVYNHHGLLSIRLETKSCRILPLTRGTKYDLT